MKTLYLIRNKIYYKRLFHNFLLCILFRLCSVKVPKVGTCFSVCTKTNFGARIHKMYVRIANREDREQTVLNVPCLSMPFCQATSVQNFKTFTVSQSNSIWYCLFDA